MLLLSPNAPDRYAVNRISVPVSISHGLKHIPSTKALSLATGAFNTCRCFVNIGIVATLGHQSGSQRLSKSSRHPPIDGRSITPSLVCHTKKASRCRARRKEKPSTCCRILFSIKSFWTTPAEERVHRAFTAAI